ncbi:MAG: efflux RND transporter permease subunit, partial [Nitrospina sp.]|nr:efflux RND transporter permease subunit [Nitrospina sp.]
FTLQAQEGRLFAPMAFTWTYSLIAAALLAVTLVPVLMGYFIRGHILPERYNPLNLLFTGIFKPIIWLALRMKLPVIAVALVLTAATWIPLERLGSEFMPPLNEGDVLYMPSTLPGISITKARELLQQTDKIIKTFPEVHHVFGKIGRAETATDTAPLSMVETSITMKPKSEWREGITQKMLIEEMDAALKIPGVTNVWTMPIKNRIDMLSTGIKTPVGIKIAGDDLNTLERLGKEVESLLRNVPGTASVFSERVVGGNYFDFEINRAEAARYGLTVGDIQDVIQSAIGGMNVSTTVQGLERYPINVRYPRGLRDDLDKLQRVLIPTPRGEHIPMAQVATLSIKKGPPVIKSENARLNAWVYIDLKDIDVGTYVEQARKIIDEGLELPAGYSLVWSGQYEYMERAKERLKLVVPLTLVIIFVLLYLNFQRVAEATIVMLSLPLALIGGVWVLYYLQYELSVAVAVGFIALAGVAAEIGVLVLVYSNQVFEQRLKNEEIQNSGDVLKAVFDGTSSRIRPIMMTVISTIGGLVPIMMGSGTGSEVMKRIAAPMIGGMVSATLLNLIVLPALYTLVLQFRFSRRRQPHKSGYSEKRELTPTH